MPVLGIVDYATARKHVASLLNATNNYAVIVNDPRHPDGADPIGEIGEAVLEADAEVNRTIIETTNNPYRNAYLNTVYIVPQGAPPALSTASIPGPFNAPGVTAASGGSLLAGPYTISYSWVDRNSGVTTPSPASSVLTLMNGQQIALGQLTLPPGAASVNWYMQPPGAAAFGYVTNNAGGAGLFLNSLPVPNDSGALLPNYVGSLGGLEILKSDGAWVAGKTAPLAKVLQWKANPAGIFAATQANIDGYYEVIANRIYFVGVAARVYIASGFAIIRTPSPTCQAPDVYYNTVVAGALSMLVAKEGDDLPAAGHYGQIYQLGLKAIRDLGAEGAPAPELTTYVQKR